MLKFAFINNSVLVVQDSMRKLVKNIDWRENGQSANRRIGWRAQPDPPFGSAQV